jgi:hypothetical protein
MKTIIYLSLFAVFSFCAANCKKDKEDKDTSIPVITVLGDNPYTVGQNTTYHDPGATATDEKDGDITSQIAVTSNVNTADTGYYLIRYNVSDAAGNAATEKTRTVKVIITK